jgi:rubredoxin
MIRKVGTMKPYCPKCEKDKGVYIEMVEIPIVIGDKEIGNDYECEECNYIMEGDKEDV